MKGSPSWPARLLNHRGANMHHSMVKEQVSLSAVPWAPLDISVAGWVTLASVSLALVPTRHRVSTGCSLPPYNQEVRNTPAPSRYPHLSPGNTLRQCHLRRCLPRERRASSAGKTASQQREDKVVALEIIISTAIQINPLAAESRQATVIPQGTGRTAVSLKTDAAFQTAPVQSHQQRTQMHGLIYASVLETLHWFGT